MSSGNWIRMTIVARLSQLSLLLVVATFPLIISAQDAPPRGERGQGRNRGAAQPEEAAIEWNPVVATSVEELRGLVGMSDDQFDSLLKVIDEGKNRNQTMKHLTHLCEEIGPRLTGSSRLEQANNWVADQFREFGLQNVHQFEWGQFPVRFDRGRCTGKMVEPIEREFGFSARSWSAGTNGPVRGPVLREPQTPEEMDAMVDQLKGAWILRPAVGEPSPLLPRLYAAGIAGLITASGDELVRTGGVRGIMQLEMDKLSPDVNVIVRRSDYDAINSRIADGQNPVVEFDLQHTFIEGPIACNNTIGEIPGTEFPDEIVIISAHLDSWDGPGSQGTVDNGTGSSVTIEAARILMAAGVKPRRTIRFVLWTGEEQGLLGSVGYVSKLSDEEKAKISAVFVDDSGTNREASLTCIPTMVPMLEQAVAAMNYTFPDVPITLNVRPTFPTRGGASDHAPFVRAGIPGFFWGKSGRADYRFAWHTQNDRLDQGIPEYLIKNSTVSAIVALAVANADTMMPRPPAVEATPPTEGGAPAEGQRRRRGGNAEGGGGDGQ